MRRNVIAATLAILAVSGCSTAHESTSPRLTTTVHVTPTPVAITPPAPAPVAQGKWAYDGPVAIKSGGAGVEPGQYETNMPPPQGDRLTVFVWVSNTGNEPITFRAEDQRLVDDKGRIYAPDMAWMRQSEPEYLSLDINPRNTVPVTSLGFAVPPGSQTSQYVLMVHIGRDSVGAATRIKEAGL
jgi:hypothetical protein